MTSNANTTATMDSIKKKMQAMKLEKENAVDRAEQAEQRQKDFEEKLKAVSFLFFSFQLKWSFQIFYFQSEEESNALQKKIQQIESELDAAQEQLGEANAKLEAKEKAATDVSLIHFFFFFRSLHHIHQRPEISILYLFFSFLSVYPNSRYRRVFLSLSLSFSFSEIICAILYIHTYI